MSLSAIDRPRAASLREHVRRTMSLAVPVMFARVGILLLVTVDTAMTGRHTAADLAFYAIAVAPQVPLLLIGIGLMMGTAVLTAQFVGAGEPERCGEVWWLSLGHGLAVGIVIVVLCQGGEWFLAVVGQSPEMAAGGGEVLRIIGWGMPAMLMFAASSMFLEGINRPVPGLVVMTLANLANFGLNWLFIYGNWGVPAMGAQGAALATTVVRWGMFVAMAVYILTQVHARYRVTEQWQRLLKPASWSGGPGAVGGILGGTLGAKLRRVGLPMGVAHGVESAAFSCMTLFAGMLGPAQVSGYAVAMNLLAMSFMAAVGFAAAASVRVGNAVGRVDQSGVVLAGWVAVTMAASLMLAAALVFRFTPGSLAALFGSDAAVMAIAIPTIMVAALVTVPDGVQGVLMGALRGTADVWPATGLYLMSFWLVMVPLGYYMGIVLEGGAPGLMQALLVGTATASLSLAGRFFLVSRRPVARI